MPIYEYKGQQYDIATTDHAEAKAKILGYLEKQGATPAPAPEPQEAPAQQVAPTPAPVTKGKSGSVLEGQQIPVEQEVRMGVNPAFIARLQAELDAATPEKRQARLANLVQREDVYGRAARTIADRYAKLDKIQSPTLKNISDRRLEAQTERLISQGMEAEAAKAEAWKRARMGQAGPDLQQLTPDVVGEQADIEARKQAQEYGDAGFWSRVGGEAKSQMTKSGLGLLSAYADLTGDEQMAKDLRGARRIEEARGEAIPKGEGVFEKSAQGAMASLAGQAPMMVIGTLTGTSGPILAQAAIQQFGDAYGEGRAAGLSGKESALRAVPLAAAEVFFERFGMTKALKGLRAHIDEFGIGSVPAYVAKAIATEIPTEQATTITQYAVDALPGIGLNKKPSMADLYKQMEETLRQTVLQAGAVAGGVAGVAKTAEGAAKLLAEPPREGGYERDLSYTGLADQMARERGFFIPEAKPETKTEQAPPAPTGERIEPTLDNEALVAQTTEEPQEEKPVPTKEERIDALAKRIATRGVSPEEALRVATLQVESDIKKKLAADEAAAEELPTYYPKDKTREAEIFRELVDQGVPPDQARGMAKEQLAAEKEDRKIAAAQTRYLKKAKKDAGTATVAEGEADVGQPITEAGGVSTELAGQPDQEQPAGGAAGPATDGVVPTGADAVPAGEGAPEQPTALTPEAEFEAKKAKAQQIARTNASAAFDQVGEYNGDINAALDSYRTNMADTLVEEGLKDDADWNSLLNAADRAFDEEVSKNQAPQAEAPAEAAPKGKRGRKPLAPEQRAVSEQKRQKQKLDANAAAREVARQEQELAKASEPLNEDDFDTDEALKTAQEEQLQRRKAAIRALYDLSKTNRNKPGQRAAEALKNSATPKEIADAKASYEYRKTRSLTSQNVMAGMPPSAADSGFNKVTNGAQALARIMKTGNEFEKLVAARILAFVRNVRVVVIQEGDELPAQLQKPKNAKAWDGARGLFIENDATGERVVYLRGDSFGEDQGVNNVTVLHELLHAATNQKLYLGLTAIKQGFSGDAPLTKATKDILRTMRNAQDAYLKLKALGRAPAEIELLVNSTRGEIFALPHEFLAYGMSDPTFQKFLMDTKGEEEDTSFFTEFVTAIRDFFKMSDDTTNALTDLIVATDKLVSAQKTERMRFLEKANRELAQREGAEDRVSQQVKPGTLSKTAQPDIRTEKELEKDVAIAQQKVLESRTAEELAQSASALQMVTDPKKMVEATRRLYDAGTYEAKRALLNGVTTDYLVEIAKDEIPELENTWRNVQEMHGMTASLMEGAVDPSTVLFNVVKDNPKDMRALYDIALEATLAEVDPAVDRRSKALNAKFDSLSDKAKYAYMNIRDYFMDMSALYSTLLDDQVNELSASAEDKANLLTKLKTIYEVGGNIVPYFSLVRRGDFWLRVGSGKNRQFYMFKTMQERDKVASELAKQRRQEVGELIADRDFQIGNDLRSLRLDSYDTSAPKLTALMDAIDGMQLAGANAEEVADQKNRLKDSVYQLYLMSLPDQSFRKKFISREGITGFSTDLLQNFSDTATTMAVQLSRIKYARKIRNSLLAARKSIAERPELAPFTEEMGDRVALELPSTYDDSKMGQYADAAANLATRASFLYFLSGASSALLQPISILQFAYPLLGARHGYVNAAAQFMKMLKVWNAYSISRKNSDGSTTYIMPTLRNSGAVQMDGVEQRAMQQMIGRNVAQVTLAGELMARRMTPTEQTVSKPRRYAKNVWWGATGALMQTAERLAQEMVYLTSFRLARSNAKDKFRKSATYKSADNKTQAMADFERMNFQSWVDQAVVDTHESLGNMTTENRPPAMRGAVGKVALQFHMFPLHATIQVGKNAKRMILPLKPEKRAEAAKIFWGQMATTTLLVGASGLPMFYTLIGFLSGMWRDWSEERDLMPADLRELDFQTWFKQKFLPEQFGSEYAKVIDRGLLNYATGADFSSRLSLANMWLREGKETRTEREAATQVLVDHMGATVSQGLTYADAMKDFRMGNYRDGIQKMSPAFIRNWISMERLRTEGAKDTKGVQLLSKDAISTGELIWRAVGFNSDELANLQSTNFKVIGIEQRINNQRNDLLQKLDTQFRNKNVKGFRDTMADVQKFNTKYPWNVIEGDDIANALEKRAEARGTSFKGVTLSEKNAPYAIDAIGESRKSATEKERKARGE